MRNVLVSIGLPTYNRPKTLERTLDSLVNQTHSNIEIIISDNCSTNSEVESIISKFLSDERVKYYRQPVNKGAIFNFNFLLEKISGDYFMRLGDDDWLDPNFIESCLSALIEDPELVCAYGQTKLYNLDNVFIKFDTAINLEQRCYSERLHHFFYNVTQNGPFFGVIRTDLKRCVTVNKRLADDWLGVARLAFNGKIKMVNNTYLNMSQGGMGSSFATIVQGWGLSKFNHSFPFLFVSKNVFLDIINNPAYSKINFFKRVSLATSCAKIIYRRFNVKNEIKAAYKRYVTI